MDQLRSQNIKSFTHHSIIKAHYLIKLTQLLLSVSLCYFLFSPSSLLALLHYFNFYFSTFPFQLFTHTVDKNCMFLLCNGLLVFVGITRSFSGSSGGDDRYEASSKYLDDDGSKSEFSDVEAKEPEMEEEAEERMGEPDNQQSVSADQVIEVEEEDTEIAIVGDEEEEQKGTSQSVLEDEENGILYAGDEEEEDKESEVDDFLIEENLEEGEIIEEEEEEEENCLLSTEELNKKFDDFIRRMREDLRIEALQQQLIMV